MARTHCYERPVPGVVPVTWSSHYIGIPFKDQGRSPDGCDCWGLVRLIYNECLGIDLPTYGEISSDDLANVSRAITTGKEGEVWYPVETPQSFDVAVMRFHGSKLVGHVGVMVNAAELLHAEKSIDAAMVPINHFTIRQRLVGFRRHKSRVS